ncbi:PPPDE putative peptidase domain-containing protein [Thelephora terrestris]|uniref:PPPDE putative peptidase domain-containing protein n=1 Tax=Thelephora terrestris TaxID=56493 RepID=A0A9P6H4D4_9AGAM|nr:PPPDE putative peptidase domain-containing protein [Thelephora terrestris]
MTRVRLYVYDLSNGLARQLSPSIMGKQIDGIWHTSVVVFDREIFYGRGIQTASPGASHHGQPLQVLDMGETALDEDTFDEYLVEMMNHYTAEKYHLLDFNCNSFTSDCVGFLTGGTVPSWIKDLPSDFLSTDFGRALRPTIDRMYSGPTAESFPSTSHSTSGVSTSLSRSTTTASPVLNPGPPTSGLTSIASPIHVSTNLASFQSILTSHRAVVAFFTSATCGPCRFIEPTFEEIAEQKTRGVGSGLIAFVKVDIQVGAGHQLASRYSVRATPTFIMFINQQKKREIRGVNAPELRTQVDMLLFESFPPHAHLSLSLPHLEAVSTTPIMFRTIGSLDAVVAKLCHFIDSSALPEEEKASIKDTIESGILPFLKLQISPPGKSTVKPLSSLSPMLTKWAHASKSLTSALSTEQLFPVIDLWRIGFLSATVGTWVAGENANSSGVSPNIIFEFLKKAELKPLPRSFVLTLLKFFSNALGALPLSRQLLAPGPLRERLTSLAISQLLEEDNQVRATAASLVFNIASCTQAQRAETGGNNSLPPIHAGSDTDWEIEVLSAIIEGIRREENEEILHRLVAGLGLLLRLSPAYESQLSQLLEVFQVRKLLEEKASSVAKKADIVELTSEVGTKLCP